MKLFIPMRDDLWSDPSMAMLPLVPFRLEFACLRDMDRNGEAAVIDGDALLSDGFPGYRPA